MKIRIKLFDGVREWAKIKGFLMDVEGETEADYICSNIADANKTEVRWSRNDCDAGHYIGSKYKYDVMKAAKK